MGVLVGIVLLAGCAAIMFGFWLLYSRLSTVAGMGAELRSVSERISAMERTQGSSTTNLLTATSALRTELSNARSELTELQSQARVRADLDRRVADSVRRLETVIAGTHSKGAAGENILDVVFAKLPVEWQVRDFRVDNKTVEFALRLPNDRVLPIDSKWPATNLLEEFAGCEDPVQQQRTKAQIETAVMAKAREVRKYIDPHRTVGYGIAAVPDAVYDLCSGVQYECFRQGVVLIGYSMFVPYLLLVFQTTLANASEIDVEQLGECLASAEEQVHVMQEELEGRFARALTMLANSKSDMAASLNRINSSLAAMRTNSHVQQASAAEMERFPELDDLSALGS